MVTIIAELCQNHGGSRETLGAMIREAAENGADVVKMQSIWSEDLVRRERFEEGIKGADGNWTAIKRPYEAEFQRLRHLELSEDDHRFFIEECQRRGVVPMTTVFARRRIDAIAKLPWKERVVKVASYDCGSLAMLSELCDHFDHLIISTGASFDEEIERAAQLVQSRGKKLTLLHCVTSYPNTLPMCNLARMEWLKKLTPFVGWSDHTLVARDNLLASKAAIALGAQMIERHFTILSSDDTKDGPVSITPKLLSELRAFADLPTEEQLRFAKAEMPNWDVIVGAPTRDLTNTELLNRDYYRGRFASFVNGEWIQNWDEKPVSAPRPA